MNAVQYAIEIIEHLNQVIEEKDEALRLIANWAEAYPLEVFPEPDLKRAEEVLSQNGLSLTAISASAMRHVITSCAEIARDGLKSGEEVTG